MAPHDMPIGTAHARHVGLAWAVILVVLLASSCASSSAALADPEDRSATATTATVPVPSVLASPDSANPAPTNPAPTNPASIDPGSAPAASSDISATGDRPNILLLIADDLGIESGPCYGVDSAMVNLESRCDDALVFDTAWSSPTCSPTRSGLLTGQHTFRTGVGAPGDELAIDAATLPRTIRAADPDYALASFGKWHLGGDADRPNQMGWDYFGGLLSGGVRDYEDWTKVTNGVTEQATTYATTEITNNAIDWIGDQDDAWLAWVAYTAPHTPFHLPPADLHNADLSGTQTDIDANPQAYYEAAVEALDSEIDRLLGALTADERQNTIVIFIGDNGNPTRVSAAARGQAKGSLYPAGIQVPMMVWGPGVFPGRSAELVGTIDIHATILDLLAIAPPVGGPIDSVSFADQLHGSAAGARDFLLSESAGGHGDTDGRTVRTVDYQLLETADGQQLFDLAADPGLANPLQLGDLRADQAAALHQLTALLPQQ